MNVMPRYVLFDCPPDDDFISGLKQSTGHRWHTRYADGRASVSKPLRLVRYFLFPLRFLLTTPGVEEIVAWQQFYGILAAAYLRLARRKIPVHILTFIYKPKGGLAGKLMYRLVDYALSGRNVGRVVVYSPDEVDTYSRLFPEAASKFAYLPLGIPSRPEDEEEEDAGVPAAASPYVFAAGRSNRDYAPLKEAAERVGVDLRIACPEESAEGFSRTTVLADCFGARMERELRGAAIVAVPLASAAVSSGQLALLQGMRAGRPVVATDHPSLRPYVKPGETALLVSGADGWEAALRRLLADPAEARRLGAAGRRHLLDRFTLLQLGRSVGTLIAP